MQRKLRAVFRSKKSKDTQESSPHTESTSPRSQHDVRQTASLDERRPRQSDDSYRGGAQKNGIGRPLSSHYDSRPTGNAFGAKPDVVDHKQAHPSQPANDSIASDYKAYLPVLSPVYDAHSEDYMTMGGDRRLISGETTARHGEDVANRNINWSNQSHDTSAGKPLPPTPGMCNNPSSILQDAVTALVLKNYINGLAVPDVASQGLSNDYPNIGHTDSMRGSVATKSTRKYSLGSNSTTTGGLVDSILPHTETSAHKKDEWKNTKWPVRAPREEANVDRSMRTARGSGSDHRELQSTPGDTTKRQHLSSDVNETTIPIDVNGDIHREIQQLLDGVVDLRNTVDEDKEVQWAPAVTHEVVKPHEHEIIQHKIFREIHNYEYYHHIQPVYDIEVLPPRHWIPNPDGEGLIEISADELPSRTGNNRRWKIVHEQIETPSVSRPVWRTEPEIIEHPTTITEEGFERKETTIIYPPTLQDMSEYEGLVQPVHFDHKTGKRWLGEITTMHKLRQETGQLADPDLTVQELGDALPHVPEESDVPALSYSPTFKRKPVAGPVPAQLGELGRPKQIAVAV